MFLALINFSGYLIYLAGTKPGVFSLVPDFSSSYIPASSLEVFLIFLNFLHKPSYFQLQYNELCETVFESDSDS